MRYHVMFKIEIEANDDEEASICAEQVEHLVAALFYVRATVTYPVENVTGI